VVQDLEPAIVHLHLWPTVPTAALSLVGLGTRIIVHVRDTPPSFRQRNARSLANRWLHGVSLRALRATCVSVSRAAADHTAQGLKVPAERLRVILNGIDLVRFPDLPSPRPPIRVGDPCVVGSGGRFSPEKGHLDLIRAVAAIRRSGIDIRLRIAGDGSLRGVYVEQARALGLGDALELPGAVQDMGEFYRTLDLFVLPSLREGLPRMLLEAMASGIPCVATDVEGVPEVLTSGIDGLLVPPGDVHALQAAVERMYHEPALRTGLAARGRRRVQGAFTLERVYSDILGVYDEVLGA
jgi:glycosyltransferase involved in cell wall biosynthesis